MDKKNFSSIVKYLASMSKNERLKVGALIIKNDRIVSSGYNGVLPGKPEKQIIQDGHDVSTIHAEQNALMNCCVNGISTKDSEMVISHYPCAICTKLAIMAGIKQIFYVEDYKNDDNVFKKDIIITKL